MLLRPVTLTAREHAHLRRPNSSPTGLKTNFLFTHEGVMCKLACGDANESWVPRGRRHHLTAGALEGGAEQQLAAGTSFCEHFPFVLAEESNGSSWCIRMFPQAGIHYGQIYLWGRGQHYPTASVDQCLRAQTWTQSSSRRSNLVHFTKVEHTLWDPKVYWLSAPPGPAAKQSGQIIIKAFWFAEKGNFSN